MTQPRKTSTARGRGSVSRGAGSAGGVSRGSGSGGVGSAGGAVAGAAAGGVTDAVRRVSTSDGPNINGAVGNEGRISTGNIAGGGNNDRGGGFFACLMACSGLGVYVDRLRSIVRGGGEGGGADAPDVMPLVGGVVLGASLVVITYRLLSSGGCTCKVEAPNQPQHAEPVPVGAREAKDEEDKEVPQKKKRLRVDLCPGRT